jgi:hypothetical protein
MTPAYHNYGPKAPKVELEVLPMTGPAPKGQSCIFCKRLFAPGDRWLKVGFRSVGYIGAHEVCSELKDAEKTATRTPAGGRLTDRRPNNRPATV